MQIHDWSNLVAFDAKVRRPKTLDELKDALRALTRDAPGRPIKILGGLHSCSKIFESGGVISTEDLPQTIEYADDDSAITISTNWHLVDILHELSQRNKSLAATGGTNVQTLAGVISTNTAPATSKVGMYDAVEWVEYFTLDDNGNVIEKRVNHDDPAFAAAICSLGAIGVLTRVRTKIIDQPYFEVVQKIIPIKDVLDDVDQTSARYDFWRINWLQNSERGLLWAAKQIPANEADPAGDYAPDKSEEILRKAFMFLAKVGNGGPLLDSVWKRLIFWVLQKFYKEIKVNGPLRHMLPVDRRTPLHVAMAEWFFDPKDLSAVLDACRWYFNKHRYANLPIEIELAKGDGYYMSPLNHGLPYVVKFNFQYMTDPCSDAEKLAIYTHLEGLWNHLVAAGIRFKAHWGKINFLNHEYVNAHYQLDRFQPFIRPEFLNDYLADRLTANP